MTAVATNIAAANDLLFGEVLACDELRPAHFVPGMLDDATRQSHAAGSDALLRALAVIEDSVRNEDTEQPGDLILMRMEAKIDLLTQLVAGLCNAADTDPVRPLRWSVHGACIVVDTPLTVGDSGHFRVRPADWLPSSLRLPARVIACGGDADGAPRAWLRFEMPSPALEAALERHLFRIHRRSVAQARRPR